MSETGKALIRDNKRHFGKVFIPLGAIVIAALCARCVQYKCNDCDWCPPNEENEIGSIKFGVNQDNIATVVLALNKAYKCEDTDADYFWLFWNSGSISVEIQQAGWSLDESIVEFVDGELCWLDRPLQVVFIDSEPTQVRLDFIENGIQTYVRCAIEAYGIACVIE